MTWYGLAILSTLFYGTLNFLFKVSAHRKYNTAWMLFSFMLTATILGVIAFFVTGAQYTFSAIGIWLPIVSGLIFFTNTALKTEALKHIETSIHFSITRLKILPTVLLAMVLFSEALNTKQIIGIVVAILVVVTITKDQKDKIVQEPNRKLGLLLTSIMLVTGTIGYLVIKYAAVELETYGFIMISYAANVLVAFLLRNKLHVHDTNPNHKGALILGMLAGIINFFGYVILLTALQSGPLSIVGTIQSMMFVVAILLTVIVYKEKLTAYRIAGVLLTIVALILLR